MTCGYRTGKKDHAVRHFKVKHAPQIRSSCHVCHKVFRNAYYRDIHRRQAHRITNEMMQATCEIPDFQDY